MKRQWEKLALRVDALTLRERGMVFAALAAAIIFVVYYLWLDPLYARQKLLLAQMGQQQNQIAGIDAEITQKVQSYGGDPDVELRKRIAASRDEVQLRGEALRNAQEGLVAPERMIAVVEDILRGNGKLKLLSLKTLPVEGLSESIGKLNAQKKPAVAAAPAANPAAANPAAAAVTPPPAAPVKADELLYRHGVEVTLQGSYPDMVNYMAALEALPTQLFWGRARLDAGHYPNAKLTLTLYTLSLDQKWMKL